MDPRGAVTPLAGREIVAKVRRKAALVLIRLTQR